VVQVDEPLHDRVLGVKLVLLPGSRLIVEGTDRCHQNQIPLWAKMVVGTALVDSSCEYDGEV
jgi:TusA-related sulfurtransferase